MNYKKKKKTKGEAKSVKISRRRDGKKKRYSRKMIISTPKGMSEEVKRDYKMLYLEARKRGVDQVLLEKINMYNYEKDVSVLGHKTSPLNVEATLIRLVIDMEEASKEVNPLVLLKEEGLVDKNVLDALAINTLWRDISDLFKSNKLNSRGFEELQALKGL